MGKKWSKKKIIIAALAARIRIKSYLSFRFNFKVELRYSFEYNFNGFAFVLSYKARQLTRPIKKRAQDSNPKRRNFLNEMTSYKGVCFYP